MGFLDKVKEEMEKKPTSRLKGHLELRCRLARSKETTKLLTLFSLSTPTRKAFSPMQIQKKLLTK